MASNPYEVEHNIKAPSGRRHARRPDMATFYSRLPEITPETAPSSSSAESPPRDHNIGPTPVDVESVFRLLAAQMTTLQTSVPEDSDQFRQLQGFLDQIAGDLHADRPRIRGLTQEHLDALDRVPKKSLEKKGREDGCPICAEAFLNDPYPLVVELPCPGQHRFDLECVGPWLLTKGTCPMCRHDFTAKKEKVEVVQDDEEEEDDVDGLYG